MKYPRYWIFGLGNLFLLLALLDAFWDVAPPADPEMLGFTGVCLCFIVFRTKLPLDLLSG